MAELSAVPGASGVLIPTDQTDRVEIGLAAAVAIVELVRFAVEGHAYVDGALPILQARGAAVDVTRPEPVAVVDLSRALQAAQAHIEEARSIVNRTAR